MMGVRLGASLAPLLLLYGLSERPAQALPTMIRLGYSNCAACHISPEGAGLLNGYGRGIDEAQSLKGGEYQPSESGFVKTLSWGGRITQDFRSVDQEQLATSTGQAVLGVLRTRFMYRNATELGKGFRFSAVVTGENVSAPRPNLKYEPGVNPTEVYVTQAMFSYRPLDNLEFSAGRDQLPSGVNITDLSMFIKSRNRMGYYDAPTQVKLFWWGKRYHINPYAFGPAGNEHSGFHESGGGALAEFDVLGHQRTVLGVNALRGASRYLNRNLIGPYARLGFGKWGILAEHDITDRTLTQTSALTAAPMMASFRQQASYVQAFWAIREWLVPSLVGERLTLQKPYAEHLRALKFEVAARLSNRLTVQLGTRMQHNDLTGKVARSVTLQLAMKTVN